MKFEGIVEKLKVNVSRTAGELGKKTENFVEVQKLKTQVHSANREIAKDYQEIGEMIYRQYLETGCDDEQIKAICDEITELKAEIEACKKEIGEYKGESECPECGAAVPEGSAFCMKCGTQMPAAEEDFEESEAVEPETDSDAAEAFEEIVEEAADKADDFAEV